MLCYPLISSRCAQVSNVAIVNCGNVSTTACVFFSGVVSVCDFDCFSIIANLLQQWKEQWEEDLYCITQSYERAAFLQSCGWTMGKGAHFTTLLCAINRNFKIPRPILPEKPKAFELLKIGSLKLPSPRGQNGVQMHYPIVGFACQMSLLKNNPQFLWSVIRLLYISGTRRHWFKM